MARQIKGVKINGTSFDWNASDVVTYVTSPNGTDYILKVDNDGNLYAYDKSDEPAQLDPPSKSGLTKFNGETKLYINEFYCGGKNADEHTMNYCSHNFVELANITAGDINLKGLSLQYTINGNDWKVLPLEGVIKAGSTFVIRGAQCSMIDSPTTKIVVDKYDMEWYSEGSLITFDSETAAKFYLTFNLTKYPGSNPYNVSAKNTAEDAIGYVDLVGVKGTADPEGFEISAYTATGTLISNGLSNKKLFRKYYAMDPCKVATKAIGARNNANDWCYIDLTKEDGELIPSIEVYRPMASSEHKDLFYNKTKLSDTKPSVLTCSFGMQATDNTADGGSGATRCFNWLTKNLDDKYIWIRTLGASSWGEPHESFYEGDGRTSYTFEFYNRKIKEYSGNVGIIANKFIMSGFTAGTYEYIAGKKNADGTPNLTGCTDVRKFTVRTDSDVNTNGFKFVQTSDQQGFNWEEYQVWAAAADNIKKEYPGLDFTVNTGDMTQNGNRMGEWLDYFNGKNDYLNDMVEMATIGNNDLSLNKLYEIGHSSDGDVDKLWHENIEFFFTFEINPDDPTVFAGYNGEGLYYIPSLYSFNYGNVHFLCMNTEIKDKSETLPGGYNFGDTHWGVFYPQIKAWCERDLQRNSGSHWKIAYCHEMPFTILVPAKVLNPKPTDEREGSNANTNTPANMRYWFSEFCQTHDIPLVFGGHKHTQAITWPLLENVTYEDDVRTVNSMKPIIVVDSESLKTWDNENTGSGATELFDYNGGKYPDTWFDKDESGNPINIKSTCTAMTMLCTFKMADQVTDTPVVYAMSQATGYKHTSNKELPSPNLPWQRYYFPSNAANIDSPTVNAQQKFPFYTVWEVKSNEITGTVRKVYGAFNSKGKFDINLDGPYTLKGKCATDNEHSTDIYSINGITNMSVAEARTNTTILRITK